MIRYAIGVRVVVTRTWEIGMGGDGAEGDESPWWFNQGATANLPVGATGTVVTYPREGHMTHLTAIRFEAYAVDPADPNTGVVIFPNDAALTTLQRLPKESDDRADPLHVPG